MTENRNAAESVRQVFETHWSKNFLIDGANGTAISYGRFFGMALAGAELLTRRGHAPGSHVVLRLANSPELAAMYLACGLVGAVAVAVDPAKGTQETADILSLVPDAREPFLETSDLAELSAPRTSTTADLELLARVDAHRPFLTTFTSGSTGRPKGVTHSLHNLVASARAFASRFAFDGRHVFYHNLPMTYMAGILNLLWMPMMSGSAVVLGPRFSAPQAMNFWELPIRHGVNALWLVPTIATLMVKLDRNPAGAAYPPQVGMIVSIGTAPVTAQLRSDFEAKYGVPLYESYGLSETLFVSSQYPRDRRYAEGVGPLLDGVRADFADDGEIGIEVPWMFLGYAGEPQGAPARYASGDLGCVKDGELMITGRKKDLIIRGGVNISPRRLEEFVLLQARDISEAVALGVTDPVLGEKTVCFCAADRPMAAAASRALNDRIAAELGREYVVDEFVFLTGLPKHSNGKVDKLALAERYQAAT